MAVDQGVADHRRIHAVVGSRQDQVVDGHPGGLVDGRLRQVVFEVDDIAGFAARRIPYDARTAGMQERLVRTFQSGQQGLHGAAMVAAGGVDHRISLLRLLGQYRCVVEGANHGRDAQGGHFGGLFSAAHQASDVMAGVDQAGSDGTADKPCGAGNEYIHGGCS